MEIGLSGRSESHTTQEATSGTDDARLRRSNSGQAGEKVPGNHQRRSRQNRGKIGTSLAAIGKEAELERVQAAEQP
jgi:hypothetical protein